MPKVAYFSMEIGLEPTIPTYSGGLGILAGDTLRAAADLRIPMVGVTLVHRKGYFRQHLDAAGGQSEAPAPWSPEERLETLEPRVSVTIEGRPVEVRAWRYSIRGVSGHEVPVLLLDTDLPANDTEARALTDHLYGGDARYRLSQEVVLGLGGPTLLRALGFADVQTFHMNEGHSALLGLALLEHHLAGGTPEAIETEARETVRQQCVFTTHTPVPAGHDKFPRDLVRRVLGPAREAALDACGCVLDDQVNMTHVALTFSRYVNGVAMRHGHISRDMFPGFPIDSITNGVHAVTWTSRPFAELFDQWIPEWRRENLNLRHAVGIPLDEIREAHGAAKARLLELVSRRTGVRLDPGSLTIGFARRTTPYKRTTLLFHDLERLRQIARQIGPVQLVFAGKAHPRDEPGKGLIRDTFAAARALAPDVPLVWLEDYDMEIGGLVTAGVDLWLNTPYKPQEASGTSGMKAALNGVPSLSVLDGWWIEGHVEGITGWSIGDDGWDRESDPVQEAASLYTKLERDIVPLYRNDPDAYTRVCRAAVALNGSFFNAQRMVHQYAGSAYRL